MNLADRATTDLEKKVLAEAIEHGVETDVGKRWEKGISHHPESERLGHLIGALDWMFGNDFFGFKFGGDGDNGECLCFVLDIYFETQDKIREKAAHSPPK